MANEQLPSPEYESPPWGRSTKIIVAVVALLLIVFFGYRFQSLIAQLVIAAIMAYILNPVIVLVDKNTSLKRGTVILLAYLLVATAIILAVVALGVIIRGATAHFEHIAGSCTSGLQQLAITHGIPVGFGVITAENMDQAIERSGTKAGNKGAEAALAALETANLLVALQKDTR